MTAWRQRDASKESTRGAGGFEVSLEGMMRISFSRDPEEAAAGFIVFSRNPRPAASGGERVANQHAAQRARRRKLPITISGKIRTVIGSFLWVAVQRRNGKALVFDQCPEGVVSKAANEAAQDLTQPRPQEIELGQ